MQQDKGYARVPNGTGGFVIQAPTFNKSNDLSSTTNVPGGDMIIRLYPNPAHSVLNIACVPDCTGDIIIRDFLGREVLHDHGNAGIVDVSGLLPGTYLIQQREYVRKLIVQ
jgi:hypothetical protein